jgi:hypothetical protein
VGIDSFPVLAGDDLIARFDNVRLQRAGTSPEHLRKRFAGFSRQKRWPGTGDWETKSQETPY